MNELSTSALATKQTIEPCNILIVGAGEVGQGLYDHMNEEVSFKDIGHLYDIYQVDPAKHLYPPVQKYDWLFITIPWSDKFVSYVEEYKEEYECNNVIIFSSVPIGTSRLCGAAHSPVEGRHPHLAESFYIFTRFLGGGNIGHCAILEAFFPDVVHVIKPEWTEFAKLSSTTLYGVNLEYARYRQSVCEELEMNYELLNQYDRAYNTLYYELEEERFVRYILDPPKGKILGHCVLPNAKLLERQFPMPDLCKKLVTGE